MARWDLYQALSGRVARGSPTADFPINENWPSRFAAEPVCASNCGLTHADDALLVGIVVKVPVMLFEVVGETQHLKAVAIADGPELTPVVYRAPQGHRETNDSMCPPAPLKVAVLAALRFIPSMFPRTVGAEWRPDPSIDRKFTSAT
jgi:hypothetical protein